MNAAPQDACGTASRKPDARLDRATACAGDGAHLTPAAVSATTLTDAAGAFSEHGAKRPFALARPTGGRGLALLAPPFLPTAPGARAVRRGVV